METCRGCRADRRQGMESYKSHLHQFTSQLRFFFPAPRQVSRRWGRARRWDMDMSVSSGGFQARTPQRPLILCEEKPAPTF
ncbi:hypothetical protein GDO86_009597 [Hymenochirus boettgeri]|uniref:Uncharacterized protein n=1 Tax=Hymenochirus boettgeri TaxID=247094 RepID=A0A8T2JLV5_9PIPI|nr:hypothetical protein GDO86_009597 [Hymenochirus boettgeri]